MRRSARTAVIKPRFRPVRTAWDGHMPAPGAAAAAKGPMGTLGSTGPIASFVRFVACGGGVGVASSGALLLLTNWLSIAVANAIVTVLGTLLCNELHSRITFRKGAAGWRVHAESTGTAVVAYLFTTGAMLALEAAAPHAGALTIQAVYLAAQGLAGLGRFVVLRLVVFARPKSRTATATATATGTPRPELVIAA
ncbi:hypothetical protein ACPA54_20675 [Uniformispora flossi]|uniref:hypothetical protein n=1 Tax=Uniformispora flossi TaxID=3390723 RepID=UPI003C2AF6EA